MSRRTAEAAKAIREAWENEQQLVTEGKGTRDWTPEQQQSIIDVGKAYDDDGKAFIGHHMKSAEMYPEYQGDPENIQFLSYQEHFKAHDCNWRNPSNWYYDPVTETKHEFGDDKYVPCEIKELSNPLPSPAKPIDPDIISKEENETKQIPKNEPVSTESTEAQPVDENDTYTPPTYTPPVQNETGKKGFWEKVGDVIGGAVEKVKGFHEEHPILSKVVDGLLLLGGKVAVDSISSKHSSSHNSRERSYPHDYSHEAPDIPDDLYNGSDESDYGSDDESNGVSTSNYPDERSSPTEHDVSGYTRQQNGKTVNVRPHKRGGK